MVHVVVLGAGFAGLEVAKALGRAAIRTTVIDRRNHHLFQPLLYQVATAALSPAEIAEPIRRVLRYDSVGVMLAEVTGVNVAAKSVLVEGHEAISFDVLVVATGSMTSYFGHDTWASSAPGLKTIHDARHIRSRVLHAFEKAEISESRSVQRTLMTTAVVGAGPTGVEIAGSIAELARYTLARDFRRIVAPEARVLLIEAGPRILPAFSEQSAAYVTRRLFALGVELRLGVPVSEIGEGFIDIAGERIEAGTIIWAAGVKASPAGTWLGVPLDRSGRVAVRPDLSVEGLTDVYALGDLALLQGSDGRALPGLAQVAKQQGVHLGRQLALHLKSGTPIEPFKFRNRGNVAIVGRHAAVYELGRIRLQGWPAWIAWAIVHIYLLVGFQKRILVAIQWLWRYVTYERGARLLGDD